MYEKKMDLTCMVNIIVLYGFIAVSYLAGYVSVGYSKKISGIIESQAIANDKLLVSVLKDQMTDLYNHRAFFMELDASIEHFKADGTPFCLAMIDVDDFKSVNDLHGHDCGDAVLVTLANILDGHCGQGDRACRYGGEEFAMIFNDKELDEAKQAMTEILEEFRNTRFGFSDQPVTFSCGVAQYRIYETRESFFNLTDRCMYGVKQSGKNRVSVESV